MGVGGRTREQEGCKRDAIRLQQAPWVFRRRAGAIWEEEIRGVTAQRDDLRWTAEKGDLQIS